LPDLATNAGFSGRFSIGRFGGYATNKQSFISNDNLSTTSNNMIMGPADALFAGPHEKLMNKLKVFNDMKQHSVQLPFNPKAELL
jgi:hypothetical protein